MHGKDTHHLRAQDTAKAPLRSLDTTLMGKEKPAALNTKQESQKLNRKAKYNLFIIKFLIEDGPTRDRRLYGGKGWTGQG